MMDDDVSEGGADLLDLVHEALGAFHRHVLQGELQRCHSGLIRLDDLQTRSPAHT